MYGKYFAIEGGMASGKSTVIGLVETELRVAYPGKEILTISEPGTSEVGRAIRKLVQGTSFSESMTVLCETLLYAAAREQDLVAADVRGVLRRGGLCLSDRSYISSLVIQGIVKGLGMGVVSDVNSHVIESLRPNRVFVLDLDPRIAAERRQKPDSGDRHELESLEFWDNVRLGYLLLASQLPGQIEIVDANRDKAVIAGVITQSIIGFLGKYGYN